MESSRPPALSVDLLPRQLDGRGLLHAVLNALNQSVALITPDGQIVAVNRQWREFGDANDLRSPNHGVGMNYF